MASRILLACAALQFPQYRVRPTMMQFIELLKQSSSWRVRLDVLLPLQGVSDSLPCIRAWLTACGSIQSSTSTTCTSSTTTSSRSSSISFVTFSGTRKSKFGKRPLRPFPGSSAVLNGVRSTRSSTAS